MKTRLAIVIAAVALMSVWTHARPHAAGSAVDFAAALPLAYGEWVGRDAPPLDPDVARVLAADQYVHRYYGWRMADGGPRIADRGPRIAENGARIADVEVDIAYYARPQAGTAMHSPLNCLPGNGWQVIESRVVPVTHDGGTAAVRRLIVTRGDHRLAMTYWFQNRGTIVGNEYRQRLQLLANGLQARPTDAALVRVMALDTPDGHAAMTRFTQTLIASLLRAFA